MQDRFNDFSSSSGMTTRSAYETTSSSDPENFLTPELKFLLEEMSNSRLSTQLPAQDVKILKLHHLSDWRLYSLSFFYRPPKIVRAQSKIHQKKTHADPWVITMFLQEFNLMKNQVWRIATKLSLSKPKTLIELSFKCDLSQRNCFINSLCLVRLLTWYSLGLWVLFFSGKLLLFFGFNLFLSVC